MPLTLSTNIYGNKLKVRPNYLIELSAIMFSGELESKSIHDLKSSDLIKKRSVSLARTNFKRQDALSSSGRKTITKRNSELDSLRFDNYQTGSTKLMNLIKSGFHLSKFKSKSKMNLNEKGSQSFYMNTESSKSEENLTGSAVEYYHSPIRVSNVLLTTNNPILYTIIFTKDGESTYKELVVLDKNCSIQIVHPSIVNGESYCFQIIKRLRPESSRDEFFSVKEQMSHQQITKSRSYNYPLQKDKLFSLMNGPVAIIQCQSIVQRNEWIMRLKKHINPHIDHMVRHEDILRIWIQEAKNLFPKKRYFCEIKLDQILYGRTTTKQMNDMVFWGEEFQFPGLRTVRKISVSIFKITDNKKKRDKAELVAVITIPCCDVQQNCFTEKWYSCVDNIRDSPDGARLSRFVQSDELAKSSTESAVPMIRVKARYRPLNIIPTKCYDALMKCLLEDSILLVTSLENHLKVKSKEEFVGTLLLVLENKQRHLEFLADVVLMEVYTADPNVLLRGNSIASKAMECYLKMVGEEFLSKILSDMIDQVTQDELDCEVDPLRIQNIKDPNVIVNNQKKLMHLVESVWNKILKNSHILPNDLKSVFSMIREKLGTGSSLPSGTSPKIDQVISSCLFLRFICPAIMSPFLFGLASQYSEKHCINRTFTLVAKCIQSLANFSQFYHSKEAYMGFMEEFLISKASEMHSFIFKISTSTLHSNPPLTKECSLDKMYTTENLGINLAELSYQLTIYLSEILEPDYSPTLFKVRSILEDLSKSIQSLKSDDEENWNNFRSLIPVRKSSTTSSLTLNQVVRPAKTYFSIHHSSDIEEDFSFIPKTFKKSRQSQITKHGNYVDFESIDERQFTERYEPQYSSLNDQNINKIETNDHSCNANAETETSCSSADYTNLHSIPIQIPSCVPNIIQKSSPKSQHLSSLAQQESHSPKLTLARQPNIYRRIQRNSNAHQVPHCDLTKMSPPNIGLSLNSSFDTLDTSDNMSGSDYNSPESNKSVPSMFTRKSLNVKRNQRSDSTDRSGFDERSRSDNVSFAGNDTYCQSKLIHSNSISCDVDIDSFVCNELIRLKLLFEFYKVPCPILYQGNSKEQQILKSRDENTLKTMLLKKSRLSNYEIISYISASYRFLTNINQLGEVYPEFIVKSVMEINKCIQTKIKDEIQKILPSVTTDQTVDEESQK